MGQTTSIQWTDATWNPVRGCSRVSPGCENCYAERQAARFSGHGQPYHGLAVMGPNGARWTREVRLVREHLEDPLRWAKPRRIFVNSMSDLFHESLSDLDIGNVFSVMETARSRGHIFQILTKRQDRMQHFVTEWARKIDYADDSGRGYAGRYSHVWLGVSVEDQQRADERIPKLLETPAAIRFVSYEPALGPVDFYRYLLAPHLEGHQATRGVHWIIVGGESGPGARPFDIGWATRTMTQCRAAGVACFVKQLGRIPSVDGNPVRYDDTLKGWTEGKLKDSHGGDWSEWPSSYRVRQFPEVYPRD
jgi:protein gp37